MNENIEQLKDEVLIKENRIQELNDTIAQQNQRLEELQQLNQDYYKIIEVLNYQITHGNQCLYTANINVDLIVHDTNQNTDQVSATTSPLIGPIHDINYTNENFVKLFKLKKKLDIFEENDKWTSQLIEVTDLMSNWEISNEMKSYNNQIKPIEIIEETKIKEIIKEITELKNENDKEETWNEDSKQNITTEIPNVFKDLIDLNF